MSGILYVTGTPIGNLSDLSPRAVETLEKVDFIAAEDTRVTLKLLNHFGIKKRNNLPDNRCQCRALNPPSEHKNKNGVKHNI